MKERFLILSLFIAAIVVAFISYFISINTFKTAKNIIIDDIELYQNKISYPYKASKEREQIILNNINKLKKGVSKKYVLETMTKPDEANLTYKYVKVKTGKENENITGFSLVYLLKRDVDNGSVYEKNEKFICIFFDKSEKLIYTAGNIEGFNHVKK